MAAMIGAKQKRGSGKNGQPTRRGNRKPHKRLAGLAQMMTAGWAGDVSVSRQGPASLATGRRCRRRCDRRQLGLCVEGAEQDAATETARSACRNNGLVKGDGPMAAAWTQFLGGPVCND